jgi:hypothetical protein
LVIARPYGQRGVSEECVDDGIQKATPVAVAPFEALLP